MIRFYKNGYTIKTANPTGGKAGKGKNKTSTIQVLKCSRDFSHYFIVRQFRFVVGSELSLRFAIAKAVQYAEESKTAT